jgi:hypothetical protein
MIREDGGIQEFCVWDGVAIPENRRRKGAVTCSKECARNRRKHYLLERKERYRRAAGLPQKGQGPGREEKCAHEAGNHVPGVLESGKPQSRQGWVQDQPPV